MITFDVSAIVRRAQGYTAAKTAEIHADLQDKVLDMVGDLQAESPVDTGAFRNEWDVEEVGGKFIVENRSPYGKKLAEGHSNQAPDGWVDNVVARYFPPRP